MAEDKDFQERTEQASSRKREKARDEGQVAKSQDLNAAVLLCLGAGLLLFLGPLMGSQMSDMMARFLGHAPEIAADLPTSFAGIFSSTSIEFLFMLGPLLGVMIVIAVAVNAAQVGFKITPNALRFRTDRINPLSGAKRLFSARSLVTLVRDLIKLAIIGLIAWWVISSDWHRLFALSDMAVTQITRELAGIAAMLMLKVGGAFLALSLLDYLYQRFEFEKSIRMSKQELKEEHKETEGSPQVKARIRQIQREMLRRRMLTAVATADVVVTNPTHIAVALAYDQSDMAAPVVVAKGERLIAEQIKELARKHGVPVVENKPLARSLFKVCDIGQVIPAELFRAVAEVLAYVYRLKGKRAAGVN